jgi:hypothetical protein
VDSCTFDRWTIRNGWLVAAASVGMPARGHLLSSITNWKQPALQHRAPVIDMRSVISTPNLFAILAIILWPLASVYFYRTRPAVLATIWTILAAQLLLPVGTSFKFEMIPLIDKSSISSLCALLGCMIVTRRPLRLWTNFGFTEVLLVFVLVGPIITSLLNGDPVEVGGTVLPGVGIYDGLSASLSQFFVLIPFLLGRQLFRNSIDLQTILETLSIAGLIYSVPLLFEIRMSPQLHYWFYGYAPSDFIQEIREGGGFRPMVFMGHGLIASFFAMTTVVAAAALWRMRIRVFQLSAGIVTPYLGMVLILCKSGAALVYGVFLVPIVRWARPSFQTRVALLLSTLALLYPTLRMAEIFPTRTAVELASNFSEERAGSLKFRFDQEEELLKRAAERPFFGWGRFGRNRVFREDWQGVGVDTSVTDGRWVITFGQFGLFGFLGEFVLLALPVFRAAKAMKVVTASKESISLGAVALVIAINIIELLPNSTLDPWTWLIAGSLLGWSEAKLATTRTEKVSRVTLQSSRSRA